MPLMKWDPLMSVSIPVLDEQHMKLIDVINELYDGMMGDHSRQALGAVLEKLTAYADEHFKYEEDLFAATNYPLKKEHADEHESFKLKLKDLMADYQNTVTGVGSIDTLGFLKKWLTLHILSEDKKYVGHLVAAGVR